MPMYALVVNVEFQRATRVELTRFLFALILYAIVMQSCAQAEKIQSIDDAVKYIAAHPSAL